MNKKTLYAFFVILIIIAFIIIWFGKGIIKTKKQPVSQETNQQQPDMKQESITSGSTQNFPFAANNSPGITIIKKDRKSPLNQGQAEIKTTKGEALVKTMNEDQKPRKKSVSSGQSHYNSGKKVIDKSYINPAAGVTKLNKRPTEEESREMNAKGIILY